jgi:hypothetical protein
VLVPLPPVTSIIGSQLTSQWLVLDDAKNNAGFVMSDGVVSVIGL